MDKFAGKAWETKMRILKEGYDIDFYRQLEILKNQEKFKKYSPTEFNFLAPFFKNFNVDEVKKLKTEIENYIIRALQSDYTINYYQVTCLVCALYRLNWNNKTVNARIKQKGRNDIAFAIQFLEAISFQFCDDKKFAGTIHLLSLLKC